MRGSNQDTGWVEQSLGGPKGGAHVEEEPGLGSLGGGPLLLQRLCSREDGEVRGFRAPESGGLQGTVRARAD